MIQPSTKEPPIIQIAVTITPEVEEGVANLLIELGANGLMVEEKPPLSPIGPSSIRIVAFFQQGFLSPSKFQEVRTYLQCLEEIGLDVGPGKVEIEPYRKEGWEDSWKALFKPLHLGRLVIKPGWEPRRDKPGEVVVEINPGQAFGTGAHASTQLCLLNLDRYIKGMERVLDLGTGSGILAIAAAKLGARAVVALDLDLTACQVASENMRQNQVSDRVWVAQGSLEALKESSFDMVVANLTAETISRLINSLSSVLRPGGLLILSGILMDQMEGLKKGISGGNLRLLEEGSMEGWVALTYQQSSPICNALIVRVPHNRNPKL